MLLITMTGLIWCHMQQISPVQPPKHVFISLLLLFYKVAGLSLHLKNKYYLQNYYILNKRCLNEPLLSFLCFQKAL